VFSTKHRVPILTPEIRVELHPLLSAILTNDGCRPLQVGGVEDHVHLLFGLSRTRTISQIVENDKTSSSKWLKTKGEALAEFHWQNGYGVFSVSQSHAEEVVEYIRCQDVHHKSQSFQNEFREILVRERVEFDERYVWD